jgi:fatty-acyl-CoA synthase
MLGYLDDEAATSRALTGDGFVRTGDLGHTEEDGGFIFLARMGDVLRLGGYLVAPAEIEAHLAAHPAVERAVVVGVDTGEGARAFAFVVPGPGAAFDEAALMAHCAAGLAKFKHPLAIRAVEDFPVTQSPNGVKIRRDLLRKMAGEAMG